MQKTALAFALLLAFSAIFAGASNVAVVEAAEELDMISHFEINIVYVNVSGGVLGEAVINLRRIPNQTISAEGVADFYKLELFSNGERIGSNIMGCSLGAGIPYGYVMGLSMNFGHVGAVRADSNDSRLFTWSIWYDPMNPRFVVPLTLRLSRMGWVVINGNDTHTNLNLDEKIQEVQLVKSQNSYIYGNPPPKATPAPNPPTFTPSPSPTQKPVSSFELTPTHTKALVVIAVIVIVIACTVVFYIRKYRFQPEWASSVGSAVPLGSQAHHQ
jgi:hypothetical protein